MTKILDCTFRDGGYYTNWCFDQDLVKAYFDCCVRANIDLLELGFLFPQSRAVGPFGRIASSLVENIGWSGTVDLGFMINAADYPGESGARDLTESISELRLPDKFRFVRIAVDATDYEKAVELSTELQKFGFDVFINLMRIAPLSETEIKDMSWKLNQEKGISGIYFADSFGSMDPITACQIHDWLRAGYSGDIGFHGHDNKGLALANSLALINEGISLVDSTICGIGRGAGNTKTEFLLGELESVIPDSNIKAEWIEHLSASNGFQHLVEKFRWGANLPYYKAASKGIHPSYVQALLESDYFSKSEIITALDELARSPQKSSFNRDHIDFAFGYLIKDSGAVSEDLKLKLSGAKRILLLGGNAGFGLDNVDLDGYDNIVAVNGLDNEIVSAASTVHFSLNPARVPSLAKCSATCVVVPSLEIIPALFREDYAKAVNILFYPARLETNEFSKESECCSLMYPLSLEYALNVLCLICGRDLSIDLLGFEGYDGVGALFEMNQVVLDKIRCKFDVKLHHIGETSYV